MEYCRREPIDTPGTFQMDPIVRTRRNSFYNNEQTLGNENSDGMVVFYPDQIFHSIHQQRSNKRPDTWLLVVGSLMVIKFIILATIITLHSTPMMSKCIPEEEPKAFGEKEAKWFMKSIPDLYVDFQGWFKIDTSHYKRNMPTNQPQTQNRSLPLNLLYIKRTGSRSARFQFTCGELNYDYRLDRFDGVNLTAPVKLTLTLPLTFTGYEYSCNATLSHHFETHSNKNLTCYQEQTGEALGTIHIEHLTVQFF